MKGVPIDESLCAYLKEYRRGQENAASSKELEAAFHSYEWFGGNVNCKYLVAYNGWDDEFHLLGQHAGACAEVVNSCHNELSLSCIAQHRGFLRCVLLIAVAVVYRFCRDENKSIFAQRYGAKAPVQNPDILQNSTNPFEHSVGKFRKNFMKNCMRYLIFTISCAMIYQYAAQ